MTTLATVDEQVALGKVLCHYIDGPQVRLLGKGADVLQRARLPPAAWNTRRHTLHDAVPQGAL
jgi:hypothetical protein